MRTLSDKELRNIKAFVNGMKEGHQNNMLNINSIEI